MQSVEDKLAVVNRRLDAIDNNVQNSDVSSQVRELRGQIQELQHQQQKWPAFATAGIRRCHAAGFQQRRIEYRRAGTGLCRDK